MSTFLGVTWFPVGAGPASITTRQLDVMPAAVTVWFSYNGGPSLSLLSSTLSLPPPTQLNYLLYLKKITNKVTIKIVYILILPIPGIQTVAWNVGQIWRASPLLNTKTTLLQCKDSLSTLEKYSMQSRSDHNLLVDVIGWGKDLTGIILGLTKKSYNIYIMWLANCLYKMW